MPDAIVESAARSGHVAELCRRRWNGRVVATADHDGRVCRLACRREELVEVCEWLTQDLGFAFATLIVEEQAESVWSLTYVFYKDGASPWMHIELARDALAASIPSISTIVPAADWHEREAEDLFGLMFEGHPRLGEFVLHMEWPEGVNPMRRDFDARQRLALQRPGPKWEPPTIVTAPGAFAMPIGPVFSDFAESAHFLLETVGEDVIHTIPRFFYKYRGVEKLAEGERVDRALLLAERFTGTAAFAHGLAFCRAVETICGIEVPPRAHALRTLFAELERLRHHAAAITGICNSTALAVATSQAALIEENLLRLSCEVGQHRYLFGVVSQAGLPAIFPMRPVDVLATAVGIAGERLRDLEAMLRYSSSFLDRLEEVGSVRPEDARAYGLVGPIARASGIDRRSAQAVPLRRL